MSTLKQCIVTIVILSFTVPLIAQDYATLYFYRKEKITATGVDFKIYLNELEVAQIHNGGRLEYRIYKPGRYNIMVGVFNEYLPKSDAYENVASLDLRLGESYYFEGGNSGMKQVSTDVGRQKFAKHKDFEGMPELIDTKPFDHQSYVKKQRSESAVPDILVTEPALTAGTSLDMPTGPLSIKGVIGKGDEVDEIKVNQVNAIITSPTSFTAVINIQPGQNTLNLTTRTVHGQSTTKTYIVNGISKSPETSAYRGGGDPLQGLNVAQAKRLQITGKYYALIIGIDQYSGHWNPLSNAVNDAKAMERMLQDKYRFDEFITLYDQQATRSNILSKMEYLVTKIEPEDNLLIYYSGHGEFKESLDKGYWVPIDSKSGSLHEYISNSDIQTFLAAIDSKHTLLISDACFSGDIFRGNTVSIPFENSERYYSEVNELKSRQAISSGGIEPVMDGGKDGHSVFTYYVLKALENNDNPYFDSSQLYDKIKIPVINNSRQTPKYSPIKDSGDEGGHFIFVRK